MKKSLTIFLILFSLPGMVFCQIKKEELQVVELGNVNWYRNYNEALIDARIQNKPILILFQEVPGCSTCINYGENILSHPLIVDALENEFIPLAIYNNNPGEDSQILKKYKEPAWNNPVVRIINFKEFELTDRLNGDYSVSGLALKMKIALLRSYGTVPEYINLMTDEMVAEDVGLKTAYFKMHCFWAGESALGKINGVINTTPGYMSCGEVVEVNYYPELLNESDLLNHAKQARCSPVKRKYRFRPDIDLQYYLKKSKYRFLPLTSSQRTKINSALASNTDPDKFLSPQQLKWKKELKENDFRRYKILYSEPFDKSWKVAAENFTP